MKKSKPWLIAGIIFLLSAAYELYNFLEILLFSLQHPYEFSGDSMTTLIGSRVFILVFATLPQFLLGLFCFSHYRNKQENVFLLIACVLRLINALRDIVFIYRSLEYYLILNLLLHILLILLVYKPTTPVAWLSGAIVLWQFVTGFIDHLTIHIIYYDAFSQAQNIEYYITFVLPTLLSLNYVLLWCGLALPFLRKQKPAEDAQAE